MTDKHGAALARGVTLTVPNSLGVLPVVIEFVRSSARIMGLHEDDLPKLELAVEEAVANVIEHAYGADEVADFEVSVKRDSLGVVVGIRDEGLPYDPSLSPKYVPGNPDDIQASGMGSFLMKRMVDQYQFMVLGERGKETRLLKYIESESVAENGDEPEVDHAPADRVPEHQRIEFEYDWMRPDQALDVARCIYDAYGYSYIHENVYHPDRLAAMNTAGELRSAVAMDEKGVMAGHGALIVSENDPQIADLAMLVVKKDFRGQSVAGGVTDYLLGQAVNMGLSGLYAEQVTVHPYTQKFLSKIGFKDCGMWMAYTPTSVSYKGIAEDLAHRITAILCYKYLTPPEPVTIYPPSRHAYRIMELYENIGGLPVVGEADESIENDHSEISISVNAKRALATVRVGRIGRDIGEQMREKLYRLRLDGVHIANLYLNLTDPGTPDATAILEQLGFRFTGIMPGTKGGDSMLLQLLDGVVVDYESMQLVSDTAKELVDYAMRNDPFTKNS